MLGPHQNHALAMANYSGKLEKAMDFFLLTKRRKAFSDAITHYITVVNIVGICTVVSLFGIATNIINLVVWKRQGFQETVNITLFAVSISDMVSLLTSFWVAICYNPFFLSAELPFYPLEVQLLTGDMPHMIAMNITGWLTAYMTFERCLCVAFPFKVKDILTTRRTKLIIVLIPMMVIAPQTVHFWSHPLVLKFDLEKNRTLLGLTLTKDHVLIEKLLLSIGNISNTLGTLSSFIVVIVSSIILVVSLNQKTKWRQKSIANTGKGKENRGRDQKVMKMVIAIAIIFIVSYSPAVFVYILVAIDQEMSPGGLLANNYFVAVSFAFVFETVNASVNIFVYYNMSSKFKAECRSIFFLETFQRA